MPPEVDMRRVREVVHASQPHLDRVKLSSPPGTIWLLKTGRAGDFGMRCDRAVKKALALGWVYVDFSLRSLRPTAEGLREVGVGVGQTADAQQDAAV